MAPKQIKKDKAPALKGPPAKIPSKSAKLPPPTPSPSPSKQHLPRPKAVKPELVKLEAANNSTLPVDVFHATDVLAASLDQSGQYVHTITLKAGALFNLVNTDFITEGKHAGRQAILLEPAKPFRFMQLPKATRVCVYRFYLAQKGTVHEPITFDGKRANREPYAKTFAEGSKNRVGLIASCREIYGEVKPLLYARTLRFESTTQLHEWMAQVNQPVRLLLRSVEIVTYTKTSSRLAFHLLSEARYLTRLHIEAGVSSESDPVKAAKAFYAHAYKLLEAIGSTNRIHNQVNISEPNNTDGEMGMDNNSSCPMGADDEVIITDGIDVFSFDRKAFVVKDPETKVSTPWSQAKVDEFKESLRALMNS